MPSNSNHQERYLPSSEEITAETARIREMWDEKTWHNRVADDRHKCNRVEILCVSGSALRAVLSDQIYDF